jgi:hypothetical protein
MTPETGQTGRGSRWTPAVWLAASLLSGPLAAAGDGPPGVWFLNAAGTGAAGDRVRLSVGGAQEAPPTSDDQLRMGWIWKVANDPPAVPYPDAARKVSYQSGAVPWEFAASESFPTLGIGPANELWFLASHSSEDPSSAWAEMLDAVEAAFRQSALDPGQDLLATMEIGRLGGCRVVSAPVDPTDGHDSWMPRDLLGRARPSVAGGSFLAAEDWATEAAQPVRVLRFRRWVEGASPRESCRPQDDRTILELFAVPASDSSGVFLLKISSVSWRDVGFFDLHPDGWTPSVRRISESPSPIPRTVRIDPFPETDPAADGSDAVDLCRLDASARLCQENQQLRRRLYTAVAQSGADLDERGRRLQEACRSVLSGRTVDQEACRMKDLWRDTVPGCELAVFTGTVVLTDLPRLEETWYEGSVRWLLHLDEVRRLVPDGVFEVRLLDGQGVFVDVLQLLAEEQVSASAPESPGVALWMIAGLALLATQILVYVRTRAEWKAGEDRLKVWLEDRLRQVSGRSQGGDLGDAVDRRLSEVFQAPENSLRPSWYEALVEAVRQDIRKASADGGEPACTEGNEDPAAPEGSADGEETQAEGSPNPSTSEATLPALPVASQGRSGENEGSDPGGSMTGVAANGRLPQRIEGFRRRVRLLPDQEGQDVETVLEAGSRLGYWIEELQAAIVACVQSDAAALARRLPDAAAKEWKEAYGHADRFAQVDAPALRTLARIAFGLESDGGATLPATDAFLGSAGWLRKAESLPACLKSHLEPYESMGRLSQVTLALQYLVEAYPHEHLEAGHRTHLQSELSERLRRRGLPEDFHEILQEMAAGIGLEYRPVPYYLSRIDQDEFDFVRRRMVSTISLSERIGVEVTVDPAVIVRLERPFYFVRTSGGYYAGHAHRDRS